MCTKTGLWAGPLVLARGGLIDVVGEVAGEVGADLSGPVPPQEARSSSAAPRAGSRRVCVIEARRNDDVVRVVAGGQVERPTAGEQNQPGTDVPGEHLSDGQPGLGVAAAGHHRVAGGPARCVHEEHLIPRPRLAEPEQRAEPECGAVDVTIDDDAAGRHTRSAALTPPTQLKRVDRYAQQPVRADRHWKHRRVDSQARQPQPDRRPREGGSQSDRGWCRRGMEGGESSRLGPRNVLHRDCADVWRTLPLRGLGQQRYAAADQCDHTQARRNHQPRRPGRRVRGITVSAERVATLQRRPAQLRRP